MSTTRIGIAVVVLATLLSSAALARVRLGIGPVGVARFAVTRVLSLGGLHHARAFAHRGQIADGWWRHGDGGYGWVGPLFWPFAYQDIYDYAIWGDGIGFWDYGYSDVYAAIFAPYG